MNPITGHLYDFCIATKEEFNQEYIKKFLEPLVKKYNIEVVVTDGAKMYIAIMKELKVEHKLCNFHKMENLVKKLRDKLISYNKKNNKEKIEENKKKIEELSKLKR